MVNKYLKQLYNLSKRAGVICVAFFISMNGMSACAASGHGNGEGNLAVSDSTSVIPTYTPGTGDEQPVIAVIGENSLTELTDYVVPYGILKESGVASVYSLSTKEGPIQMFPALKIQPQKTVTDFDNLYPEGADYVIVPAVHNTDDPDLLEWISDQAAKGATIVGICDGVWVVAKSGLLEGRRAVGHWYSFKKLSKKYPETEWVRNSRYIADGNVITTTGVTASIPVSLALVEAIAGKEKAEDVAVKLGVTDWSPKHKSSDFKLKGGDIFTGAKNWVSFWSHDDIGVPVFEGIDEIALALLADAYSRTYRSKAFSVSPSGKAVFSSRGLEILPDKTEKESTKMDRMLEPIHTSAPAQVLDETLQEIEEHYGRRTAEFVALQLEYSEN